MANRTLALPHCFQPLTVAGIYRRYVLALTPAVILMLLQAGPDRGRVLVGVLLGVLVVDAAVASLVRSESVAMGNGLYLAMVLVLLLPGTVTWYGAVAAVALTVCAKWFFGGVGRYWIHPAMVAAMVLSLVGEVEAVASAEQLVPRWDAMATQFLNETLFRRFEMAIPEGSISALLVADGARAGVTIALLGGSIYLLAHDLVSAIIPALGMAVFLIGGLVGRELLGNSFDPLTIVSTSPLVLLIFFVVGEPTTAPHCHGGRSIYGAVLGLSLALTAAGSAPQVIHGVFLAALSVPMIDLITDRTARTL